MKYHFFKTNEWISLGLRGQELLSNIGNAFTGSVEVGLYDKIKFFRKHKNKMTLYSIKYFIILLILFSCNKYYKNDKKTIDVELLYNEIDSLIVLNINNLSKENYLYMPYF